MNHPVTIGRRAFIGAASLALAGAQPTSNTIAKTRCGQVRGAWLDRVLVFKGIPYAGSPEGAGRFKPAPKLKPWTGVRDALLYGPQSMQLADPFWPKEWKPAVSSEDCLYLNVWTQGINDGRKRPVMFYSHGGGFNTGNGGAEVPPQNRSHDGAALARDYDVVVVTHNHRLNIMGYLHLGDVLGEEYAASGVAGMLDIAAALQWVHDNIENFGGDPDRVMIWGESGGGAKTTALSSMPAARGQFHRVSVESGSAIRMRTRDAANTTTGAVLAALGLNEKQGRQILQVPPEKLIDVMRGLPRRAVGLETVSSSMATGLGFSPMVDGHHLPAHPYDPVAPAVSAKVPLLVGTNRDETLFLYRNQPDVMSLDEAGLKQRLESTYRDKAPRILEVYRRGRPRATPSELYIAITTAQWMGACAITMAERKAEQNTAPVYMYEFAVGAAAHAAEIAYKFSHVPGDPRTDPKARAARNMSRAWASFARNGNPSHDEIPVWPAYTLAKREVMVLDAECRVAADPHPEERLLWKELL